jgi:hypothetical protein
MKYVSRPFFFGSYLATSLLSLFLTKGPFISGESTIEPIYIAFIYLGSIFSISAFIILVVLLYKMWKILPSELARTTPGKAVGFLFIPIFNFYWNFQAIWGWTKDFNLFIRRRHIHSQHAPEGLGLAIAIFCIIGGTIGIISGFAGVPAIGMVLSLPNLILIPVFIYKACTILNNLPDEIQKEIALSSFNQQQQADGPIGFGVASLVLGILSILIPYIGLVLGIIGIVLAVKQRRIRREGLSLAGFITSIIGMAFWSLIILMVIIAIASHTYLR